MKLFVLSEPCLLGVHCATCRDRVSGVTFRTRLMERFAVPGDVVDFECPPERGAKPWGWTPPSKGLGDTVSKVTKFIGIKECGGCAKRKAILNKLVPWKQSSD